MNGDMGAAVSFKSQKDNVSPEEWDARLQLAALYRLVDHYGFSSTTANHMTARVPGEPNNFLINPRGYLFSEICASSLVKIDLDGNILSDAPTGIVNPAGYNIHSAVMSARPDVQCAVHLHTIPGTAVSALKDGLQFLCQESMRFYGCIGFHDYEGIARQSDERERLAHDLGNNFALILRNHGSLIVGRTIAEAFAMTLSYEHSCKIQVAAQGSGAPIVSPSAEICEKTSNHRDRRNVPTGDDAWKAYRRLVDFHYPSYAN